MAVHVGGEALGGCVEDWLGVVIKRTAHHVFLVQSYAFSAACLTMLQPRTHRIRPTIRCQKRILAVIRIMQRLIFHSCDVEAALVALVAVE